MTTTLKSSPIPDFLAGSTTEGASPRRKPRVLVLDDARATVAMLARVLAGDGWEVFGACSVEEAAEIIAANGFPEVAIVDVFLGRENGLTYVGELRARQPNMGIMVISSEDTETLAEKAIRSGADAFLSKPIPAAALILTARKQGELQQQRARAGRLEKQLAGRSSRGYVPDIVAHSGAMKEILEFVEKVAREDLSALVIGESGTGKELIARAIHQMSSRARNEFVELNCAALPANLVESELFGHEKGAFTGAVSARVGKVEQADGGTLFLDEIGELPLEIQPKLLRALQEKRVVRVGGRTTIQSDFRLVTATNRDLAQEVRQGRFREDLFYRVAVFPIRLPPLRERMKDLDLLLVHFLRQYTPAKVEIVVSPEARARLHSYHWPGNVRELRNFAQAARLLWNREGFIDEQTVRRYFTMRLEPMDGWASPIRPPVDGNRPTKIGATAFPSVAAGVSPPDPGHSLRSAFPADDPPPETLPPPRPIRPLADVERDEILNALRATGNDVPEAARALGIGRSTLYLYIKKNNIPVQT